MHSQRNDGSPWQATSRDTCLHKINKYSLKLAHSRHASANRRTELHKHRRFWLNELETVHRRRLNKQDAIAGRTRWVSSKPDGANGNSNGGEQRVDLSVFSTLPETMWYGILREMSPEKIAAACLSSKKLTKVCDDHLLLKILRRWGAHLSAAKEKWETASKTERERIFRDLVTVGLFDPVFGIRSINKELGTPMNPDRRDNLTRGERVVANTLRKFVETNNVRVESARGTDEQKALVSVLTLEGLDNDTFIDLADVLAFTTKETDEENSQESWPGPGIRNVAWEHLKRNDWTKTAIALRLMVSQTPRALDFGTIVNEMWGGSYGPITPGALLQFLRLVKSIPTPYDKRLYLTALTDMTSGKSGRGQQPYFKWSAEDRRQWVTKAWMDFLELWDFSEPQFATSLGVHQALEAMKVFLVNIGKYDDPEQQAYLRNEAINLYLQEIENPSVREHHERQLRAFRVY